MRKKELLIALGCLITIIIVLGAIILSSTGPEMTLAEQMVLGSSDKKETGLDENYGTSSSPSAFQNYSSYYEKQLQGNSFALWISVNTFNSTSQCQSEYSNFEAQYHSLGENGTTAIDLGNGTGHGFILQNNVFSHYCEIIFTVDKVIVGMTFRSYNYQPWDEDQINEEAIPIAELQFQKIVRILNE